MEETIYLRCDRHKVMSMTKGLPPLPRVEVQIVTEDIISEGSSDE